VANILANIVTIYIVILAGRAVLSWFPVRGGTFLASVNTLLFELTEPVLRPVRKLIPPVGMFDMSFLVVFVGLLILQSALRAS
jgi:YggT family protein